MMLRSFARRLFPSSHGSSSGQPVPRDVSRIIALSMVKNEQDIVEAFVRHNLQFLDALVMVDNGSVDRTRSIILECARELGRVVLTDNDEFGFRQSDRMTKMLHACQSAFFADFVLFLDADEFITAPSPAAFRQHLQGIPPGGQGYMPWQTFVVTPGQEASAGVDAPRSFTHRRAVERMPFYKTVVRLDGEYARDITVAPGNHDVLSNGESLPRVVLERLPLAHVPVRSAAQLAAKSIVGWSALVATNPDARAEATCFQWRQAFDRLTETGVEGLERRLSQTSLGYAEDTNEGERDAAVVRVTTAFSYGRLYSDGRSMDPLSVVARSWERSLLPRRPVVEMQRPPDSPGSRSVSDTSFDAAWHWDNLFFDVPPFRFIVEKHQPDRVLDVGCGLGQYLKLFKALGVAEVIGVDGLPQTATDGVLETAEYIQHDLALPIDLGRRFGLVCCVEVAEHMSTNAAQVLLDTVDRHAEDIIVFSAAEPCQPGHGHINCLPLSHWLSEWARRGWVPDLVDSLGMRALATMSRFRRNLVALKRGSEADGRLATATLLKIAGKPYAWYGQPPGVREIAFADPLLTEGQGYHPERR